MEYSPPGAFEAYLPALAACPSLRSMKLGMGWREEGDQEPGLSLVPGMGVSSLGSLRWGIPLPCPGFMFV